jgi:hypothetical protein
MGKINGISTEEHFMKAQLSFRIRVRRSGKADRPKIIDQQGLLLS